MSDPGFHAGQPPVGYTILERPVGVPALLADDIDAATGELLSIDVPVHPVDAAVGFLSRCRRGSGPALETHGHRIDSINQALPNARAEANAEAARMLQPLVDGEHIRVTLQRAQIEPGGARNTAAVMLIYRNLRTGDSDAKRVPL